jgi:putative alpha-1,2-mannosidase
MHLRVAATVVLLAIATASPSAMASDNPNLEAVVNTFIGSQDEGNTFPGASAPFGLIQVSPVGAHYAGWRYDDPKIRGFGHSFISGAGCWEQGGQVTVLPVAEIPKSFDYRDYASAYTHAGEVGQAGYYRVRLTDHGGIDAEATALPRAAAERYTFDARQGTGHVLVNLGQANEKHEVVGSVVHVVGDRVVEGKLVTKSFCGGTQYSDLVPPGVRPALPESFGTWDKDGGVPGARDEHGRAVGSARTGRG